ncbi:hypothetical protein IPL85_02130 [Candidatus Saccharibacteria bacterium]|nr:MAG: hypothetical protein IPL85_02130 [Candidatus Saccharibacteria bacterium]
MKMSRIVEELERQGIEVTYENIAIFAVFASEEGLVERLNLNTSENSANSYEQLVWLESLLSDL